MKIIEKEIIEKVFEINQEQKNKIEQYNGAYYEEVNGELVLRNTEVQNENSAY